MVKRIRVTGFGGQGVITAGYILGKAATIYDDKHSILTQSYGPEARGSACSAQVIVADNPILLPFIKEQDIMIALSQEGFDKFVDKTVDDGIVLYDENLVTIEKPVSEKITLASIPSTQAAEKEFGKRIVTNIIMLGFVVAQTGVVSKKAITDAVLSVVPKGMEKLNSEALQFGLKYKLEEAAEV